MYDIMSFQVDCWVYHGSFFDLDRAKEIAEDYAGWHERTAVFCAGTLVYEAFAGEEA